MSDDPVLALMRDIERLRSALREMTEEAQAMGNVLEEDLGKFPFDAEVILRKHGVAQLMRADDTPQSPGWSGDGD